MTISLKAVVFGFGIGLSAVAVAQPVQQPQYQRQMPPMPQAVGQSSPMMNNPEMRAHMTQMRQGCERMMSNMRNHMQVPANRR